MLELANWKSEITEQYGQNNNFLTTERKMLCRTDYVTMVESFLTDGGDSNFAVDGWSDEEMMQ